MMDNEKGDGIIYSINKEQISTLVQVQITLLASKPSRKFVDFYAEEKKNLNGNFTVFKPRVCVCVCV